MMPTPMIPDWVQPLLVGQVVAFVAWCIRVELRVAKIEGRTEGLAELQRGVNDIKVQLGVMGSDIKTLYRLVDGKHEDS